ncbi:MAG TPA: GNAT family N-acetyltransferase [Trebonia sp.]
MTVTVVSVRPAEHADVSKLADVLARAFDDDPPFVWALPEDATRRARMRTGFAATLRAEEGHATVDVARDADSGAIVGGAIWFPPGAWPVPVFRQLLALPGYLAAFGRRIGPASQLGAAFDGAHPKGPHWYLHVIGVDPPRQGQGVGGALLRSRLARVDQAGGAAYLESSKTGNLPLYEHFGFRAGAVPPLPDGAPIVTPMYRPGVTARAVPAQRSPAQRRPSGLADPTGVVTGSKREYDSQKLTREDGEDSEP